MKQRAAIIFSLVIVLSLGIQGTSYAQQGLNPPPPDSSRVGPTKGAMQDENGIWYMPEGSLPDDSNLVRSAPTPDGTTSSPDAYGYYWDDIVPYSWTDTSGGTDTGMSGSDDGTGPYSLPFSFKYYENTYTQGNYSGK